MKQVQKDYTNFIVSVHMLDFPTAHWPQQWDSQSHAVASSKNHAALDLICGSKMRQGPEIQSDNVAKGCQENPRLPQHTRAHTRPRNTQNVRHTTFSFIRKLHTSC